MRIDLFRGVQQAKKTAARQPWLLALLCASALSPLLVGCTSMPLDNFKGNAVADSRPGAAAPAHLELTPAAIHFDSAIVGVQNSQSLKLANTGGTAMTVTGFVARGVGLSVNGFSGSTLLNPGTSATFSVELVPKTSGNYSGSLAIVSQTASLDTTLPVSGDVAAADPKLSVGATSVNFGSVSSGKSASETVTVTNTGNVEVTISKVQLSGAGFSIVGSAAPVRLASEQSVKLDLEFSPKAAGT
ncbi:MAG: choice-of-anchor D domain-containing protein, partial [Candidatus Acidiferrum sp.]